MSKKFQKNIEDFTCIHCGTKVVGNGYTNHCPECLWSKHVDINPGDRANTCQGKMPPVGIEIENGQQILVHRCEKCGALKRNKISEADSVSALIGLSQTLAKNTNF